MKGISLVFIFILLFFSFTTQSFAEQIDTTNWMRDLKGKIGDQAIRNIAIPGTHDSATYAITSGSAVPSYIENAGYCKADKFLCAKWAKAQDMNLYEQLMGGIRYLDLRLAYLPDSKEIWSVHTMLGSRLEELLSDINRFITEHPEEVVILDFQHFYSPKTIDFPYSELKARVNTVFSGKVLADRDMDITYNEMVAKKKNLIVLFSPAIYSGGFWGREWSVISEWFETNNLPRLLDSLEGESISRASAVSSTNDTHNYDNWFFFRPDALPTNSDWQSESIIIQYLNKTIDEIGNRDYRTSTKGECNRAMGSLGHFVTTYGSSDYDNDKAEPNTGVTKGGRLHGGKYYYNIRCKQDNSLQETREKLFIYQGVRTVHGIQILGSSSLYNWSKDTTPGVAKQMGDIFTKNPNAKGIVIADFFEIEDGIFIQEILKSNQCNVPESDEHISSYTVTVQIRDKRHRGGYKLEMEFNGTEHLLKENFDQGDKIEKTISISDMAANTFAEKLRQALVYSNEKDTWAADYVQITGRTSKDRGFSWSKELSSVERNSDKAGPDDNPVRLDDFQLLFNSCN